MRVATIAPGVRGAFLLATLLLGAAAAGQAPPATDVWLLPLDPSSGSPAAAPLRVTDRDGYDNQPAFDPTGGLLYTSERDGQTDIYRYDLESGDTVRVTATPESEYSPTPIPGRREISVVRVEADERQRLWSFGADGGEPTLLLPDVEPVGYHAWQADGSLVLFVLGEPPTLHLVEPEGDTAAPVADNVGRSLQPIPGTPRFSFLQRTPGAEAEAVEGVEEAETERGWRIRSLDTVSGEIAELGLPVRGSQDLAWTPDGRMVMAAGSMIWVRGPDEPEWAPLIDLQGAGLSEITRLAASPDGAWLALVAARR